MVEFPGVVADKNKGYGLQRTFGNPNLITQASRQQHMDMSQLLLGNVLAGHLKNTYKGRTTKPNSMVMKFNTDRKAIERAGWWADLSPAVKASEQV